MNVYLVTCLTAAIFGAGAKIQVSNDLELGFSYCDADCDTEENYYTYTTSFSSQYPLIEKNNIHLCLLRNFYFYFFISSVASKLRVYRHRLNKLCR
jgi:hypothetical protein